MAIEPASTQGWGPSAALSSCARREGHGRLLPLRTLLDKTPKILAAETYPAETLTSCARLGG